MATNTKKVIILIDGQNLYYNLKEMGVVEKDIQWDKLFSDIIDEQSDELVRTYWFRAQKLLDAYFTPDNIKRYFIYKNHRTHCDNFKNKNFSLIPKHVLTEMEQFCKETESWIKEAQRKFNSLEYIYDQLSSDYEDIEIVKKGVIKIDPYEKRYTGEKGDDIALAVKMSSLTNDKKCDKIILISGDYDYAEAIKFVKDNMTKIHIVKLHKGVPPRSKGMSKDLTYLADKVINIYEADIKDKYLKKL